MLKSMTARYAKTSVTELYGMFYVSFFAPTVFFIFYVGPSFVKSPFCYFPFLQKYCFSVSDVYPIEFTACGFLYQL